MRAYFRDANLESSSDLAPVTTILPEANMSAGVFGSRMRMMTAAKRYTWGQRQRMFGNRTDTPWDCIWRYEHAERWFSDQASNQD